MSVLLPLEIKGVESPVQVHSEYTDSTILAEWADSFSVIQQIFTKNKLDVGTVESQPGVDPGVVVGELDEQDVINMISELNKLLNLAENGQQVTLPNGVVKTFYLTYEMGRSLDLLVKTLDSVGFDRSLVNPQVGDADAIANIVPLQRWIDLDDVGLREIMILMGQAIDNSRSLQALIELEYVKTGNQVIGENLERLEEALSLTKEALDLLQRAQLLKNKIDVSDVSADARDAVENLLNASSSSTANLNSLAGNLNVSGNVSEATYQELFKRELESFFNQKIDAELSEVFDPETIQEFIEIRSGLQNVFAKLEEMAPTVDQAGLPIEFPQQGSLAQTIETILADMSQFDDPSDALSDWVLDGYDQQNIIDQGNFQRNLTTAITAGESLNDKQKEDLRRFMFVFEQFYKSASAMLQAIDRMITKMATNIKG